MNPLDQSKIKNAKSKIQYVSIAVAIIVIGASTVWLWRQFFGTYHLRTVDQGILYRDGVRTIAEFGRSIGKVKPKVVVSLIDDEELADARKPQFAQEVELLKREGVHLERIAIELGGYPSTEDVRRFLNIVADPANRPVLVHCAQGVRRTGMMVAVYQQSVLGWDDGRTKAAMETFGHSQRTVGDVQRFIEVYDEKTRSVTVTLPKGKE